MGASGRRGGSMDGGVSGRRGEQQSLTSTATATSSAVYGCRWWWSSSGQWMWAQGRRVGDRGIVLAPSPRKLTSLFNFTFSAFDKRYISGTTTLNTTRIRRRLHLLPSASSPFVVYRMSILALEAKHTIQLLAVPLAPTLPRSPFPLHSQRLCLRVLAASPW